MRSIFLFIQRNHFILLFLLLETFAFSIIMNNFGDKNAKIVSTSSQVVGYFYNKIGFIKEYMSLKQINESLVEENIRFLNHHKSSYGLNAVHTDTISDSLYTQKYMYFHGNVINNTVHKMHNYLTIDRGSEHGVKLNMAVASPMGVVGIIRDVSLHYSTAISLLNTRLSISAKLKKNNYFGSLSWDGIDYRKATLNEIPNHVDISLGDTVVTSGYSAIFPEGLLIGTINYIMPEAGSSFYLIHVKLANDFKQIYTVKLIGNLQREEQLELQANIPPEQ